MKTKLLFIVGLVSIFLFSTTCKASDEVFFATEYFKTLYTYEIIAVSHAQDFNEVKTNQDLIDFYESELVLITSTRDKLTTLTPPDKYNNTYATIIKGLEYQHNYLKAMISAIQKGLSFDQAFMLNNGNFFKAQKNVKSGIEELQIILNNYDESIQEQILSSTGLTEQQLIQDAFESNYIQNIQESIK
jgi:hypothetical protein